MRNYSRYPYNEQGLFLLSGNQQQETPMRQFNQMYVDGAFVSPHGTAIIDLINPTNNDVIGKVTMADEIDTRRAIAAAKEAFNTFAQSGKEYRMDFVQRLDE